MKKATAIITLLLLSLFSLLADAQSAATRGTLTDNSLVLKAYYIGEDDSTQDITLTFKDYSGNTIIHASQDTSGTKVAADDTHIGANTGTIFTWTMEGETNWSQYTSTLTFNFSTLQAEVNGYYYRPTYEIRMTLNETTLSSWYTYNPSDTFYDNANKNQVASSGTKGSSTSEYKDSTTITYSGYTSKYTEWDRSGTCTLNISDYENSIPGDYNYVCWVIAEYTVN